MYFKGIFRNFKELFSDFFILDVFLIQYVVNVYKCTIGCELWLRY